MTEKINSQRGTRPLIVVATLVIIIWGISQAQSVIVLFLVSIFLAVIGTEPVRWLERKRIPSVVAVLMVVATMIASLLCIGVVVGASLNDFSNGLPVYQTRLHDMLLSFKPMLERKGIAITDEALLGYADPGAVMSLTTGLFAGLGSVLSNIVLILFMVAFILLEASGFPAKLRIVQDTPRASFPQYTKFAHDVKRYMVIKTLINLVVGTLVTVWLYILGVDFPVLWGFLAFLLHFVPSVGSVVAAVPAVLMALIQLGGGSAILTAAGYLAIGTVLGNILEPRIMGRKFGMSTLVVFLSLILWGNLLGVVGALLCVPLTMTLKLACESGENTQWIATLLGPEIFSKKDRANG